MTQRLDSLKPGVRFHDVASGRTARLIHLADGWATVEWTEERELRVPGADPRIIKRRVRQDWARSSPVEPLRRKLSR